MNTTGISVKLADERVLNEDTHRNFTPLQLSAFAGALYKKLLALPANKIELGSVANMTGVATDLRDHTPISCGTTFCVIGWALTDPNLSFELNMTPSVQLELDEADGEVADDYRDSDGVVRGAVTMWAKHENGESVDLEEAFQVNGEYTHASTFMFGSNCLEATGEATQYGFLREDDQEAYLEKLEALMRCALVQLSLADAQDPDAETNPLLSYPQWGARTSAVVYTFMQRNGWMEKAIQKLEADGMNVSMLRDSGLWEDIVEYEDEAEDDF